MFVGIVTLAVLLLSCGYQFRQNVETVRRSAAEDRAEQLARNNAILLDRLAHSYSGVSVTTKGVMLGDVVYRD